MVVKAASQFGNQYQHWNGVDIGVNANPSSSTEVDLDQPFLRRYRSG